MTAGAPGSLVGNAVVVAVGEVVPVGSVEAVLGLVTLATLIATFADRLRTPAPSLLVLVGLAVGALPGVPSAELPPEVVSLVVLPPLLFAAASELPLVDLISVWRPVAVLAIGLVAVTTVAVALAAHAVDPQLSVPVALVLGAILASTDPVAVTALSRRLRLPPRVSALVQGESLFNDATSLVLFQVAVAAVVAGRADVARGTVRFVELAGGGVALGVALGVGAAWVQRRTADPTLETALAILTPYLAASLAEAVHVSSVTAVIVAGLLVARQRERSAAPRARLQAAGTYATIVFLLENTIFAIIGLELAGFLRRLPESESRHFAPVLAAVVVTVLAVRGVALFGGILVPRLRGDPERTGQRWQVAAVATWSGTRGVVPLAAALSLPFGTAAGADFPHRDLLLVVATGTVVVTLVVQGGTLEPLTRRLGVLDDPNAEVAQVARARHAMAAAALGALEDLVDDVDVPQSVVDRVRHDLQERADRYRQRLAGADGYTPTGDSYRWLRRRLLRVEAAELLRLRDAGEISDEVRRRLQRQLDLEDAGLGE